jgi:hypothetical protein
MTHEHSTPTSTSERTSADYIPHRPNVPAGLQLNVLDQVIGLAERAKNDHEQDPALAGTSVEDYTNARIEEELALNGFAPSTDDEIANRNYERAKGVYTTAAHTTRADWLSPVDNEPGSVPLRNTVARSLYETYNPSADTIGDDADTVNTADAQGDAQADVITDITERRELLDDKRTALAKLAAKRQGRLAGKGGEAYVTAKDEYTALMREIAKHDLREQLDDENLTPDQKKIVVVDYLLREQKTLREQTVTELRGTRMGKFVGWMAKGNVAVRALKGVAVGLGAGIVGAGIGALAGVAGVATVGAGLAAGATAVGRAVRGYAAHDARKGRGMNTTITDTTVEGNLRDRDAAIATLEDDHTQHVDAGIAHVDTLFERDTKHEQSKRRESAAAGMAGVVLGTTIAFGLQSAADTGLFHGSWNHLTNGGDTHATNGGQTPGGTHDTGTNPPANTNPPKGPDLTPPPAGNPGEGAGTGAGVGAHELLDPRDAFTITPGEGLYETFQEMGIPQPMWHDVMNDVGPQLQQLGDTYWDPAHAEWRISHTGQFSDKAIKLMAAAATKHGYSLAA